MKIQIREFELQNLDHMEITVQHTTLFTTSCALISESLNRSLSVYNLDILSLQTARINNAQSLFPLTAELPCSTQSNPTIRDMSFPIPNPPLNWEINCSLSSRFFFYIKEQYVRAPREISVLMVGVVKSASAGNILQSGSNWKSKV